MVERVVTQTFYYLTDGQNKKWQDKKKKKHGRDKANHRGKHAIIIKGLLKEGEITFQNWEKGSDQEQLDADQMFELGLEESTVSTERLVKTFSRRLA